jgi:uncharacterized membrane protein YraQ (UPF0718 family)
MITSTIVLWIIAAGFLVYAWTRKDNSLQKGGQLALETTRKNALLLTLAFIIVGFVNVLNPTALVRTWLGPESGWVGLLVATGVGMLLPGGPYVVFPLIAVLYQNGAGLGPIISLVTSWSTLAFLTVMFELPFMGWRFTVVRWGLGLALPLIAGSAAQLLL